MWLRNLLDSVKACPTRAQALQSRRDVARRCLATTRLRVEALEDRSVPAGFLQTNLAADQAGVALIHDPELVEAWGISINPNGTFWLSGRATDVSTVYSGDVTQPDGTISPFVKSALTVTIPGGGPTGQVFNGTSDFVVSSGAQSAPARFIFASDDGHITGWSAAVGSPPTPSRIAHIMATTEGAVYTGLAIGNNGENNFLYAADFHGDKIDIFDGTYTASTLAGTFDDPAIPDDYAPYNIWNLGGTLYVTYARPQHEGDALVRGGTGFVSAFDTNGNFLNRIITEDHLQSPWGIALAPADFGEFSNSLLVGNHQTGHINAFDPTTGEFLGRMRDANGDVIEIDGLYALHIGNGTASGDRNALYFAAAPDEGQHGLFGSLRVAPTAAVSAASSGSSAQQLAASTPIVALGDAAVPIHGTFALLRQDDNPGGAVASDLTGGSAANDAARPTTTQDDLASDGDSDVDGSDLFGNAFEDGADKAAPLWYFDFDGDGDVDDPDIEEFDRL